MRDSDKNNTNEVPTLETQNEKKVGVSRKSDHKKFLEHRDMDSLIPSKQKEWIIETIFFDDAEKYRQTMKMFNWLEIWEDASDLLELILPKNKLNSDSQEAREFTSIIRNCFDE